MDQKDSVTIIRDDTTTEVLADAIVRLSTAAEVLTKPGGLTKRALVLLLKDSARVPGYAIERVLDALPRLAKQYTIPKPSAVSAATATKGRNARTA